MTALLDAHTLIWAADDPDKLGPRAEVELADPDNRLTVSAGTVWEIGIKVGLRKLELSLPFREWMDRAVADLNLVLLPITLDVADEQSRLPRRPDHKDPFDRLLVAHARVEGMPIVSSDDKLDAYGVTRIW